MSEPLAERLSRFTPDGSGLDRDALLFAAGRASARPNRRWVALAAALERLPGEQREVIVARLWGGLSFEEIAEVAGCSASTAFRRYSAGIDALRQELGVPCPTPSPRA